MDEIRKASGALERNDTAFSRRLDKFEDSINELYKKTSRPGLHIGDDDDAGFARKSAAEMCRTRRALAVPKIDAGVSDDYTPSSSEIDEALTARKALKSLFRTGDARLDHLEKKSLSSFSFGNNGFLLALLSCLVDPTDVSGLVDHMAISAGSVRLLIDNARMGLGAWACEASCFANNPQPDLQEGLGTLELKAETLRFTACATSDLLQDASMNVEQWLFRKVSDGFRITINNAILLGTGIGMPFGLLTPNSGIPICETAPATQPGQFTWQDLVQLKFELPQQWWPDSAYFMKSADRRISDDPVHRRRPTAAQRAADGDAGICAGGLTDHHRVADARCGARCDADPVRQFESRLHRGRPTRGDNARRPLQCGVVHVV